MRTENSCCSAPDSQVPCRMYLTATCLTHLRNPVWHFWVLTPPGRFCNGPHLLRGRELLRGSRWTQSTIRQSRVWPEWKGDSFVRMPGCSTCAEIKAKGMQEFLGACIGATLKSGRRRFGRVEEGLALTKRPQGISEEEESWGRPRAEVDETSFYFWFKPKGVPVLKCPGLVGRRSVGWNTLCPFLPWAESMEEALYPHVLAPAGQTPRPAFHHPQGPGRWAGRKEFWWVWSAIKVYSKCVGVGVWVWVWRGSTPGVFPGITGPGKFPLGGGKYFQKRDLVTFDILKPWGKCLLCARDLFLFPLFHYFYFL